ncbi:phosphatidylglycerophosphatase A [Filimonas zeae]|uniref:Phosphatidylglycerophosphatase A n=1 Tax=Filimonas zeae TaxID=1737353 RepID=A0A917MXF5_9BACT|nr:phosphatidylglycerophosphatase A [Filimonas zeae]MDR6341597.1 phosphatidylglycerophosphatase A [Filimonas zeae]GGH75102.1 phosphatidylglycerophosphatase A [Filimonas zeae]
MMLISKIITTCLGIGYIRKGGGTYASIATLLVWYAAQAGGNYSPNGQLVAIIVLLVLGIFCGDVVEKEWGKDSYRVVIDEAAGMCITLLYIPLKWEYMLTGLVLFRFFDIVKPLYIRRLEKLPGGLGVMMDDVAAGIYAYLILRLIIAMHLF